MNHLTRSKPTTALFFITLALVCFGLLPNAQAVSPPPDGGYFGGNTAEGQSALLSLTTGGFNTAVGFLSLTSNATNSFNTAIGAGTLLANTADENTATGAGALLSNTTGVNNTANGAFALFNNTTGNDNTADGVDALRFNTTGGSNTANGVNALLNNTTGGANTADGVDALHFNTTGGSNTATGVSALFNNTVGNDNTANGFSALGNNTTGTHNTAVGFQALLSNTTGSGNTAIGDDALNNLTTGMRNIALGLGAGGSLTTGSDNIDIGNPGVADDFSTIRIGNYHTSTFIAGISLATASGGVAVFVNSDGQLGTKTSSARFKDAIQPMASASQAILSLKPVTFRYKKELDPAGIPQFGLVAEDVEKVNPDLVVRDREGKPYTVRYEAVNAMLLNEFLKEHRTVHELKNEVAALTATVKEQAAQIQKVSAQVEMNKPAPQVAKAQ